MWIALLIMLREGLEAALIVGIIASFLRQSGHVNLMPKVWLGVILAALFCFGLGWFFHYKQGQMPQKQQEFIAAVIGFVAVAMLTYMVLWMKNAAKSLKQTLQESVQNALNCSNSKAWALVSMAFFAVLREGLESVFFLMSVFEQSSSSSMPIGAILGLAIAVVIGYLIYQGGARINLSKFFQWTGLFLIIVSAGLFSGSLRKLHESGVWNIGQQALADWSSHLADDSPLGTVLGGIFGYTDHPTISDAVSYLIYLIPFTILFLQQNSSKKPH